MQIIYRAENLIDAHLVKDALENAGIPAFVSGEYSLGGMTPLPGIDMMTVMVPDSAVAAAEPLVREIATALATPDTKPAAADTRWNDPDGGVLPA